MAKKKSLSIPKTAAEGKRMGYKPTAKIKHADLSLAEKKQWTMVKAGTPHIVCHYNPNTGEYDDCQVSDGA
jgi:hypothetical protein